MASEVSETQKIHDKISIPINPFKIVFALSGIALFLVLASVLGQVMVYFTGHARIFGLVRLFNVNSERNIPTSFSVVLLFVASLLLLVIALIEKRRAGPLNFHWGGLSFGFLYLAFDEAWSIHEKWNIPVRNLIQKEGFGTVAFAWVFPGIIIVVVLSLLFYKFLFCLPQKTRNNLLMAAAVYIGGAIGFEIIGGCYIRLHGHDNFTYNMIAAVEEGLEMAGVIIFIWALLGHINESFKEVRFIGTM